jgi:hypothetical protein
MDFVARLVGEFPQISSVAELKIIFYVYEHTHHLTTGKMARITYEEFCHGYNRTDILQTHRLDRGTGLSMSSVIRGIRCAIEHGYLIQRRDSLAEPDAARSAYFYRLSESLAGTPEGSGTI